MLKAQPSLLSKDLPKVTVIMPVRNEANFIERSLDAVLTQDYPSELMEILVVDGMSDDGTRKIVAKKMENGSTMPIFLLDNPSRIASSALNAGLKRARGDVIIRVDGHCEIPSDYVRKCVGLLKETKADNVGGMQFAAGKTYITEAISMAMNSPFGIGNSRFRYSSRPGYVDTVYLGAWRRDAFKRVGEFNRHAGVHHDYEFNLRLRTSGGRVYYSPELKVLYHTRENLKDLARQYFRYGYWKARVVVSNPAALRLRHGAPPLLVLATLLGLITTPFWQWARIFLLGILTAYGSFSIVTSIYLAIKNGLKKHLFSLPLVFVTLHFSWGTGFWAGLASSAQKNFYFLIKRIIDIALSLIGLVLFIVITPVIAVAIYIDCKGPIFYRQPRVGKGGRIFNIYKFRTMVADAEDSEPMWPRMDDPRVTRVGQFLRKSHLDESPQFLNILKNDMSLVGPRPERPEFVKEFEDKIPEYGLRHRVKPGATGLGVIKQECSSDKEDATYKKLQHDLYYIDHQSLWLDLTILVKSLFYF